MISYLQFFGKSICNRVFCILFLCFSSRIKMAMFWPHGNAGPFQLRAEKGTCRRWICHVLPPQFLYFLLHRISVPVFFAFTRSGFFSLHFLNFLTAPHLHPCPPTPPPSSEKNRFAFCKTLSLMIVIMIIIILMITILPLPLQMNT